MNHVITSTLLAAMLTLGSADVAVAQAPKTEQAKVGETFNTAIAAYQRKDYATALSLFRLLAAQGNASAQYNLGVMYLSGQGVSQDDKEAARLFGLAVAEGYAQAQSILGMMYDKGQGVAQDYKEAVRLYGLAAAQGNASAQYNLGVMYYNGRGIMQDYKEAVRLYGLAAANGDAAALDNLGVAYSLGRGVEQDIVRAYMWFSLGAISDYSKNASTNRDIIAALMTPSQIAEAEAMARKCQASNFKQCN